MLNDEERAALNAAARQFYGGDLIPIRDPLADAMFAAGIKFAQTWRSMESAPLGVMLLTSRSGESRASMTMLINKEHGEWADTLGRTTVTHSTFLPPTHWMPLPLPPTEAK